jgi:glutamate dehydrogenase
VLESYTPAILVKNLGREAILKILNSDKLKAYRNAVITKKLSAIAFYKNGLDWEAYMDAAAADFSGTVKALFAK